MAIDVQGLNFAFGDHKVLNGINLRIGTGEMVVLLGPNGAGKTTLVELLMGSLSPQGGSIRVLGRNPRTMKTGTEDTGLVMQHYSDHGKWRVGDFLTWVRSHYVGQTPGPFLPVQVLSMVGLSDAIGKKINSLSGGQRRRVDMAAAIIGRPKLLILDEPSTGLDPKARQLLHHTIKDFTDAGATVLMTTHDMAEAQELADRVLILNKGVIVASGSPQQLRDQLVQPAEITWFEDGRRQVHVSTSPEQFIKTLDLDEVTGLEIRRPTLGDAYLALIEESVQKEVKELAG